MREAAVRWWLRRPDSHFDPALKLAADNSSLAADDG